MPELSWSEVAIAGVALLFVLSLLLAPILVNYMDYRRRRAPYDGFKEHSGPMRVVMMIVAVFALFGGLFLTCLEMFTS